MGRFVNTETGITVSVDDSKDDRFAGDLWESDKKTAAKKSSSSKSS